MNWLDVELNSGNQGDLEELGIQPPEVRTRVA